MSDGFRLNAEEQYQVGWYESLRCVRPLDQALRAGDSLSGAQSYGEALAIVKSEVLRAVARRVPALRAKYYLDIEEGLSLVTGINCRAANIAFWHDKERFFALRPDFVARVILFGSDFTGSSVDPLNAVESHFYLELSKFAPAIQAVHGEITFRDLHPGDTMPFDWWEVFWSKRGIPLLQPDDEAVVPSPSPQPPDSVVAVGILTRAVERRKVGRPGGPGKSLRIFEILTKREKFAGSKGPLDAARIIAAHWNETDFDDGSDVGPQPEAKTIAGHIRQAYRQAFPDKSSGSV